MSLTDIKPSTDSAVIRNRIDEIDSAIEKGVSRQDVYHQLKEDHELTIAYSGFLMAVKRARSKRNKLGSHDPKPSHALSGSHDPGTEAADSEDVRTAEPPQEKGDTAASEKQPSTVREVPLKKGEFGPPDDFDPTEFDTRFNRRK